ncbi:hypothetical protein LUZ60_014454 [Juncus effusus]|nr:hypothetical protein LUZ60_014454 [Juncus effusus]
MASKTSSTIPLFITLNLLFFTFASSCSTCYTPSPPPPASSGATCPMDALKLGVCADVLNLIKIKVGKPPVVPCCSLIEGLVDLEAAVCLCTAIKANVLGINLNLPIDLSLILNYCNKSCPSGRGLNVCLGVCFVCHACLNLSFGFECWCIRIIKVCNICMLICCTQVLLLINVITIGFSKSCMR